MAKATKYIKRILNYFGKGKHKYVYKRSVKATKPRGLKEGASLERRGRKLFEKGNKTKGRELLKRSHELQKLGLKRPKKLNDPDWLKMKKRFMP